MTKQATVRVIADMTEEQGEEQDALSKVLYAKVAAVIADECNGEMEYRAVRHVLLTIAASISISAEAPETLVELKDSTEYCVRHLRRVFDYTWPLMIDGILASKPEAAE